MGSAGGARVILGSEVGVALDDQNSPASIDRQACGRDDPRLSRDLLEDEARIEGPGWGRDRHIVSCLGQQSDDPDGGTKHVETPWRILETWGMSRCGPREAGMFLEV